MPLAETAQASAVNENTAADGNKKKGNSFTRALTAPFRAIGRLFGGGKKNDQIVRRISNKEAAKFESAKMTRVTDASLSEPAPSSNQDSIVMSEFDVHLQKGRAFLMAGDSNSAISELTIAALLNAKSGEVHKLLGIAFESKGLRDRALKEFEAALQTDTDNPEHLNNLGFLLFKDGDYERATKFLKRAVKAAPQDARIWNNLALVQCRREKFDDAFVSFTKAVGEYDAHINMAAQLQNQARAQLAIKHLEQARALRPTSTDVLTKLVALYELTGRPTDAENARRTLLANKSFAGANKE
jgi:Flp pilus assembly protein TadD